MPETVIALFPESQQAEEVIPILTNRGFGRSDVDVIGGKGASLNSSGGDFADKLSRLGIADEEQKETLIEAISHGGAIIATRTPDERKADQIEELMRDHGATQCMHAPDAGWTTA